MNRKKTKIIVITIAVIVIPLAVYTVSPLLINTEINEPLPTLDNENNDAAAIQEFNRFIEMGEQERRERGHQMGNEEKDMIMRGAAQTSGTTVNEAMNTTIGQEASTAYTGEFVGVNDGIHNAEGQVKVLRLNDSTNFLRLEEFKATNGPDLYIYLSTDKSASDFVNLGRLKGNVGNQNYEIPEGTDLSKYDSALIWCQAFSVLFGSAELEPTNSSSSQLN
jgi:Electron transfer DM13